MKKRTPCCCFAVWFLVFTFGGEARSSGPGQLVDAAGVAGGLVVHLGCGDGKLTAGLRASDRYLVQGLDADAENVNAARDHIDSLGLAGKVTVDMFDGRHVPLINNAVNLLVVSCRCRVARHEMLRVLAPRGVALIQQADSDASGGGQVIEAAGRRWRRLVKPWPEAMDQWTHYLHGPDNNAVAHDHVVNAPRHMQWVASPSWTRTHHQLNSISAVVTAQGRLFYIEDQATAANVNVPSRWVLVARDAFSGVTLWQKPLASWVSQHIRFRSGPPQVTRLLIATGGHVYMPLGLSTPVSRIDARTGETLNTFKATEGAEEMVLAGRTLVVLKGSPVAEQAVGSPTFRGRYRLPNHKTVIAVDPETGDTLWRWADPDGNTRVMPETLASDGKRVYLQVGQAVVCLDLGSGRQQWSFGDKKPERPIRRVTFGKYTLVVADDVVLCNLSGRLTALSAEKGSKLWDCEAGSGFHSPLDLFVIGGLVWQGSHVSDSVAPPAVRDFNEGRDLHTGEVKVTNTVAVDLQTAGHHHRCYREKATDRFILMGKRGIELMDLTGEQHSRNNWVRGTCQYGVLPANGLIYAPSHSCGCYMESKLHGFWALAPKQARGEIREPNAESRRETGPAYAARLGQQPFAGNGRTDWPMYRHDARRSGVAATDVPIRLKPEWSVALGGRLTQPVVAEGTVVVSTTDTNTVYALDQQHGKLRWKHVAGGPVDSPPVIYRGMVLFGSADGRVTCLRLRDGELVWRFLAAPADYRTVAYDRIESLWPVHGSVLLLDGALYCSAGRSTWIDGGMDLYKLDPASGKVLAKTRFQSKHPEFRKGKEKDRPQYNTRVSQNTTDYKTFLESDHSDSFSMAGGAVSDVLVSDGSSIFLHHVRFSRTLQKRDVMSRHLFSTSSLLDDAENHRSHWVLGTGDFRRIPVAYSWIVNRPGKRMPTIAVPTAVMMVYDDHAVWGVRRQGNSNGKYYLFQKRNRPFAEDEPSLPDFRTIPADQVDRDVWKIDLPVRTTAMLKTGNQLCLGVVPVVIPEGDPYASYEGREGGAIWFCSIQGGRKLAEYKLAAPVVWDGLAAANRRLFASTANGSLQCLAPAP